MTECPPKAIDRSYESIAPGAEAEFSRVVTASDVQRFADLTGDFNPLHMDAQYAGATRFGERIVHGMLIASHFSTLVGMYLPGRRALYVSQQVCFAKPVRLGERVTFRGRVRKKTDALRMLDIDTTVMNDCGEELVRGSAQVIVL